MRRLLPWFLCFAALAAGQKPRAQRRTSLSVPVWISSADWNGAPALGKNDFKARLNGAPVPVLSVLEPSDDLLLLLVLDLVEDLGAVDVAKQALAALIPKLPATTHIALLRAQNGLQVLLDPAADRAPLIEAIQKLPVSGKAGLLDTVETAVRISDSILDKSEVRVAVLYITDSDVRNYREDFINPVINSSDPRDLSRHFPEGLVRERISRVETRLAAAEAPLFIVHLDYRSDRLNEAYQAGLLRLAGATGGASTFCRSRTEIPAAVENAFQTIAAHYRVELPLPGRNAKILQVQLESPDRGLNYRTSFLLGDK